MSTLKQLIDQYCPDGVEYVRLGDVAIRQRGTAITATRMKELDTPDGDVRVFAAGSTEARINQSNLPQPSVHREPSMVVKARGYVNFIFYDSPFTTKSELWSYRARNEEASIKYITYWAQQNVDYFQNIARLNGVKLPQLKVTDTDNYKFPLPPREIQDKIVEHLDTFAALCENLDMEIAQREQQFTEYREKILSADYLTTKFCPDGLEYTKLKDIGETHRGRGLTKKDLQDEGVPVIHYGQIYTHYGTTTSETVSRVSPSITSKITPVHPGSLIVASTSENLEDLGKSTVWRGKETMYTGLHTLVYSSKANTTFIAHILATGRFYRYKSQNCYGAKVIELTAKAFENFSLPLPPRGVQDEVVSKLDAMQELIDNLRREREQRQQQFDHYREKLLSFPKKETTEV